MNAIRAFSAGAAGAVLMSILMAAGRAAGLTTLNLEMMNGSLVTRTISGGTWLLGFALHIAAGGIFALIYAWFFEHVSHRAGAGTGSVYGMIHAALSGFGVMGAVPFIHPLIPAALQAPGFFGNHYGTVTAVSFALLHLVYGAVVGAAYEPALHRRWMHHYNQDEEEQAA